MLALVALKVGRLHSVAIANVAYSSLPQCALQSWQMEVCVMSEVRCIACGKLYDEERFPPGPFPFCPECEVNGSGTYYPQPSQWPNCILCGKTVTDGVIPRDFPLCHDCEVGSLEDFQCQTRNPVAGMSAAERQCLNELGLFIAGMVQGALSNRIDKAGAWTEIVRGYLSKLDAPPLRVDAIVADFAVRLLQFYTLKGLKT